VSRISNTRPVLARALDSVAPTYDS
jgi:hypothetical protein